MFLSQHRFSSSLVFTHGCIYRLQSCFLGLHFAGRAIHFSLFLCTTGFLFPLIILVAFLGSTPSSFSWNVSDCNCTQYPKVGLTNGMYNDINISFSLLERFCLTVFAFLKAASQGRLSHTKINYYIKIFLLSSF